MSDIDIGNPERRPVLIQINALFLIKRTISVHLAAQTTLWHANDVRYILKESHKCDIACNLYLVSSPLNVSTLDGASIDIASNGELYYSTGASIYGNETTLWHRFLPSIQLSHTAESRLDGVRA